MNDPQPFPPAPAATYYQPSVPPPPPSPSRLPILILILCAIAFVLALPYGAEQVNYAWKRGELRARADLAREELERLSTNVQLVKLADTAAAFREVAKVVGISVVHINTESVKVVRDKTPDEWGLGIPFQRRQQTRGEGSGLVIDAENGYIVTNYHVIQDASAVNVKLADGRTIDAVRLIGYDVLTDLAVLKVNAPNLTAAQWGDSDQLEVGDWVLAVGNPFGLDRTVTSGIVSAKQRRGLASKSPYQDFLQTDAAVNPGNSGGPLVNIFGQVVGINTMIVGESYRGISFAIPSATAREICQKIISEGRVARGWLGVGLGDSLSAEQIKDLEIPEPGGVLVAGIVPGGPAAAAGMLPGDVIVEWNGKPTPDAVELRLEIARAAIGDQVKVVIRRDGARKELTVTIGQRPPDVGR